MCKSRECQVMYKKKLFRALCASCLPGAGAGEAGRGLPLGKHSMFKSRSNIVAKLSFIK